MICVTCEHNIDKQRFYLIKEMMYGFREKFKYHMCDYCGCLQISKIPNNLPVVALYNSNVVPGCTNVVWGMYSSGKPNNMR